MKRTLLLISTVLLSAIAGVQTAWGQKITLYMAGNQTHEYDISQVDSIVFSEAPATVEPEEIVVTIDANGNADGEHWFEKIDDTNFYIDDIKYTAQNGELVVTGYNQAFFRGAARIISKLKYHGRPMSVVGISSEAFKECSVLTSVIIPNSVTSIGEQVFLGCSGLISVTIGNGVTSIGSDAFRGCYNLEKVIVPDIAAWCGISFGNSLANPLSYAEHFYSNENTETTTITIPSSVTSIGDYAFYNCLSLTSITIPNSVTSIGDYAFRNCKGLTSITIPNSVTSIGNQAFYGCNITSVTIGNGLTSIANGAFMNCSSLTSVAIPNSVTSVGYQAFYGCICLTSVAIGSGVTSIASAFSGCRGLTDVLLNSNSVVSASRSSNTSMKSIFGEQVKHYVIGDSVTSIGAGAFYGCSSLTSFTIPNSVTSIGNNTFYGCSSLTNVYCYAENVPSTSSSTFNNSSISSAILHVPAVSVSTYKAAEPWKSFRRIVAIE